MSDIRIRSESRRVETAWFAALCSDDYELLGVPDGRLRSSFDHCRDILLRAEQAGFQNILLPNSYQVGQDSLGFAMATGPMTQSIQMLVAARMGEVHPPMLARAISTLDHILRGRLAVNIISSDLPGEKIDSATRYRRASEVIQILQQAWTRDSIDFHGEFYDFELPTDPVRPYQINGGPLLYFGGISPPAKALCAEFCDVFLMWPETEERLRDTMTEMTTLAAEHDRVIDYGLRIHVIVRETEAEARGAAQHLVSKLDDAQGQSIKQRAQDSASAGVLRQDALRENADDNGYIEPYIWSGIGRARSGCGSAIVGDPEQVYQKLQRYIDMGIRAFILSGYPHEQECDLFAKYVLPRLDTCRLAETLGRIPDGEPVTPLTTGTRR